MSWTKISSAWLKVWGASQSPPECRVPQSAETQSAEREEGSGRTVLKERYKKALKLDRGPLANIPAPDAWIELIFGIRAPDQRMGKEGSRFLFENMTEYTATNPLI